LFQAPKAFHFPYGGLIPSSVTGDTVPLISPISGALTCGLSFMVSPISSRFLDDFLSPPRTPKSYSLLPFCLPLPSFFSRWHGVVYYRRRTDGFGPVQLLVKDRLNFFSTFSYDLPIPSVFVFRFKLCGPRWRGRPRKKSSSIPMPIFETCCPWRYDSGSRSSLAQNPRTRGTESFPRATDGWRFGSSTLRPLPRSARIRRRHLMELASEDPIICFEFLLQRR